MNKYIDEDKKIKSYVVDDSGVVIRVTYEEEN
jgi:hypothetical protein